MAQSSSVAREPSMEEILASIRRIIEESDTSRSDDTLPQPVNSDVPAHTAVLESKPVQQLDEEQLPPREGIAVSQPNSQSFETALARSAPSQSKAVEQGVASPKAETEQSPIAPAAKITATQPAGDSGDELEAFIASPVLPELELTTTAPEQTFIPEPVQPEIEVEAVATSLIPPVVTEPADREAEAGVDDDVSLDLERALEPILSEATERQVSSAFEDLSFAVRNEQRRSFDEIAQDIMRPLLQDWLDNNLPTLVERLVREEIERVARGGRR